MKRSVVALLPAITMALAIVMPAPLSAQSSTPVTFRVATWNVRSGQGEPGLLPNPPFVLNNNCTDPSQPGNASLGGQFQQVITDSILNDPRVIAFTVQEGWNCGSLTRLMALLPFWVASREMGGDLMLARYGIVGSWEQVKYADIPENSEPLYHTAANVCVVPDCSKTVYIANAHVFTGAGTLHPTMVKRVLDLMAPHTGPSILTGDFNMYTRDQWSPVVPCSTKPTDVNHAAVEAAYYLVAGAGFTDAWKSTHLDAGWTGMSGRNGCGTPNGGLFKRIDYAFSKGLTLSWSGRFGMPTVVGGWSASDHVGLKAEYTLGDGAVVITPPPAPAPPPPTPSPSPSKPEIVKYIWKNATFVGAWANQQDSTAAGGTRLANTTTTNPKVAAPLAAPASYAEVVFNADAGVPYHLWFRLKSPGNTYENDSFFAQFSDTIDAAGNPTYRIGTTSALSVNLEDDASKGVSSWGWQDNGYGANVLGLEIRFATAGPHVIRFQARDDGVQIDQMVLSAAKYMITAPGTLKDDTTILPEQP